MRGGISAVRKSLRVTPVILVPWSSLQKTARMVFAFFCCNRSRHFYRSEFNDKSPDTPIEEILIAPRCLRPRLTLPTAVCRPDCRQASPEIYPPRSPCLSPSELLIRAAPTASALSTPTRPNPGRTPPCATFFLPGVQPPGLTGRSSERPRLNRPPQGRFSAKQFNDKQPLLTHQSAEGPPGSTSLRRPRQAGSAGVLPQFPSWLPYRAKVTP